MSSTPCSPSTRPESRALSRGFDETALENCRLAREVAGDMLSVATAEIDRPTRSRPAVCEARQVGMYIAHVVFQLPFRAVAEGFHRHRSTVSHAVRQIEERRDDRGFDALLERYEARAAALRVDRAGASA